MVLELVVYEVLCFKTPPQTLNSFTGSINRNTRLPLTLALLWLWPAGRLALILNRVLSSELTLSSVCLERMVLWKGGNVQHQAPGLIPDMICDVYCSHLSEEICSDLAGYILDFS